MSSVFHDESSVRDMAHDLRISLSVVMGLSASLLEDLADTLTDEQYAQLGMIVDSGVHMCELIDAAADGPGEKRIEEVDVADVCETVIGWMRSRAEAKGLFLRMDHAGSGPAGPYLARLDRHRLTRILMNLVDNAVKFTDAGGVTIFVRCLDDALAVAVTDTGCGVCHAQFRPVFDEGYRADPTRSTGTGHGLAACRRFAHEMGGTLGVGSSVVGEGTTFVLWLPWGLEST